MPRPAAASFGVLCLCFGTSCLAQSLQYKAEEGARHVYEFSQFTTEVRVTGEKEEKTTYESGLVASVEAGKRDAQGRIPHAVKVESVRYQLNNGDVVFDSQANLAKSVSRNVDFFLEALKPLVGASYTVVVDENNHVTAVEGTEEILNQAVSRGAVWLKNQMNAERLKTRFEHDLARFPKTVVKQGDAWEGQDHVDLFMISNLMKVERHYEHLGTEERGGRLLDKIGTTDKQIIDSPTLAWKVVQSKGTIYFDRQRGLEVENTNLLQIKARVVFRKDARLKSAPDQDRTVTIETSRKLRE